MIDRAYAETQAARFAHLPYYPKTAAAINDFVLAVQAAATQEMAKRVADSLLDNATAGSPCPTAADIRRAIWEAQEAAETVSMPAPHCWRCGDDGILGGKNFETPWTWCECAAGRRRRQTEPEVVDEANAMLRKLAEKFPTKRAS